jgi:hypothetical protein
MKGSVGVSLRYGDFEISIDADGAYSPDAVHDLVSQVMRGFRESVTYLQTLEPAEEEATENSDDE